MNRYPAMRWLRWLIVALVAVGMSVPAGPAEAQYFGRNKVQYDDFDFRFLETDHFQIYYYPEEEQAVRDAARMAERWYDRHRQTFLHTFDERKPIIFYANDADFQQTNVVSQQLGQGTGGLTEPLRERVVMPLTGSYGELDHVLGHELVHSFQFDLGLRRDSLNIQLQRIPIWITEGMAEYLTVGREDTHTAMWMRDAALRDDVPSVDQLANPNEYFPYRYGQALLAYIGGKYGDQSVTNLFKRTGQMGVEQAFQDLYGITADSLSAEWEQAVEDHFLPATEGRTPPDSVGQRVLASDIDGGSINISPALSPDGRWVAFLSERNIFDINLFVADAQTGEVVAELGNVGTIPHFDAIRFIGSAGTWDPSGRRLAFVSFAEGDNRISIWNVEEESIEANFAVEGVSAMKNPAWSPDGRYLAFSGRDGGISDLYVLDLETDEVRQFTNDRYADLQPTWSPDGETLAFTTDRVDTDFEVLQTTTDMQIGLIDVESGEMEVLEPFDGAHHHNPQFSPDGQSLYFIADQDGFKDIYRLSLPDDQLHRVTRVQTGVSGITALSPALSVAAQSGDVMFSVFSDGEYTGFALDREEAQGTPLSEEGETVSDRTQSGEGVAQDTAERARLAGTLPPVSAVDEGIVSSYLNDPITGLPEAATEYASRTYDPGLSLEAVTPPSVGVSAGGMLGTTVSGGVGFQFGDMLSNQQLSVVVQAQGRLRDIGGQVSYVNRDHRYNWGGSAGHIPVIYNAGRALGPGIEGAPATLNQVVQRLFIDQVTMGASYPLSTTRRFEFNVGGVRYGFGTEIQTFLFDPGTGAVAPSQEDLSPGDLGIPERDPLYFGQASSAYVVDYSQFGLTSPVLGGRYRLQLTGRAGSEVFATTLADFRRYFYMRPFTFALQGLHIGNYGAETGDLFADEYLGFPYSQGFVRGYNINDFESGECTDDPNTQNQFECPELNRLIGTRIAKASAEFRVPLLGPERLSLIPFRYVPTELTLFADGGLAWTAENPPVFELTADSPDRIPVFSAGVAARFNVLGALVLETYWAYPFQRRNPSGQWGLRFLPGW